MIFTHSGDPIEDLGSRVILWHSGDLIVPWEQSRIVVATKSGSKIFGIVHVHAGKGSSIQHLEKGINYQISATTGHFWAQLYRGRPEKWYLVYLEVGPFNICPWWYYDDMTQIIICILSYNYFNSSMVCHLHAWIWKYHGCFWLFHPYYLLKVLLAIHYSYIWLECSGVWGIPVYHESRQSGGG